MESGGGGDLVRKVPRRTQGQGATHATSGAADLAALGLRLLVEPASKGACIPGGFFWVVVELKNLPKIARLVSSLDIGPP